MIKNEVIWITGASAGIGLALAKKLSRDNLVIISGRNKAKLAEIDQEYSSIHSVVFDVTDVSQIERVAEELGQITPHLDRVILNAGDCEYFDSSAPDWSIMERMMSVNYLGMVHSLQASLELLKKANKPHLIGIGSQAILAPFTKAEGYGASKAAVDYWLHSIRIDLARFNIDVSAILPGFVDTQLTQKNNFPMPFLMSVDDAADRILAGIQSRRFSYAFPKRLSLLLLFARKCPKQWLKLQKTQA